MKSPYHLLAVTGMSPQVITETLYALHQQGQGMPLSIKIITTALGAEQAWNTLGIGHMGAPGKIAQFLLDYDLAEITFSRDDIWVVEAPNGKPIDDVVSQDEHSCVADFIVDKVGQMTSDPDAALHASLAGGRKTMTFFLGYAMSLFGREQDVLSHVLVSEGYENLRDFFYPTPYDNPIQNRADKVINTKNAVVQLAEIPFVRMRQDTPQLIIEQKHTYSQHIDILNQAKQPPKLTLDVAKQLVIVNGLECYLQTSLFTFYLWLVMDYKAKGIGWVIPNELGDHEHANAYLPVYGLLNDKFKVEDMANKNFVSGMSKSFFLEKKSKIKNKLESVLTKSIAAPYLLVDINEELPLEQQMNCSQFGLAIPVDSIEILVK